MEISDETIGIILLCAYTLAFTVFIVTWLRMTRGNRELIKLYQESFSMMDGTNRDLLKIQVIEILIEIENNKIDNERDKRA